MRWPKRIAVGLVALFFALYTGFYLLWNDASLARSITRMASSGLQGRGPTRQAFVFGRTHYPYWGAMRSLLFGGPTWVDAWDTTIYDPDGVEVLHVDHAHGQMYLGQLVWAQFFSLFPGRAPDLELHFANVTVDGGRTHIALDRAGKVNLVDAMTSESHQPQHGGMRIRLESATLNGVELSLAFPGWHVEAHRVRGQAKLEYSSFREAQLGPDRPAFSYSVSPLEAPSATLTLGEAAAYVFPIEDLRGTRFGATNDHPEHLVFEATARVRGAPTSVRGRLTDTYSSRPGADLTIAFTHGEQLFQMLPTGGILGGDPSAEVRIHGPFHRVLIDGRARHAELRVGPFDGHEGEGAFSLDGSRLRITDTRLALAGGMVGGAVDLDFDRLTWSADLESHDVDPAALDRLVPKVARSTLGGRVNGRVQLGGNLALHPERVRVRDIDLRLTRRTGGPLPKTITASGAMRVAPERIDFDDLALAGDGVKVVARGAIDPARWTGDNHLVIDGSHLGPLLRRLGLDLAVDGFHAGARVRGPLIEPTAEGDLTASTIGIGNRLFPKLTANLQLEHGTLHASDIRGLGPFGGTVTGQVDLGLFDGSFTRWRPEHPITAWLGWHGFSLEALAGAPWLSGTANGQLSIEGTLEHPTGYLDFEVPNMKLYDDPYRYGQLSVVLKKGGYELRKLSLERAGGGHIEGHGHVGADRSLALDLQSSSFPLAAIPQLRDFASSLSGLLSGDVRVGGDLDHWSLEGAIEASAVKVRELYLGDGRLQLIPGGDAIRLEGEFFQRFKVEGYLTLSPAIACNLTIRFDDFPVNELFPELKRLAELKGIVSGVFSFSFDARQGMVLAELRFSKVQLIVASEHNEDEGLVHHTEEFRNVGDMVITTDFKKYTFQQAHLQSRIGEFELRGQLAANDTNLWLRGQIQLALLEYFASGAFSHTHGDAFADLRILGPMLRPQIRGSLDLRRAELVPHGAERAIVIPEGRVVFEPNRIQLKHLRAQLDGAEAMADGQIAFTDWVPGELTADIRGTLSPMLLSWLFPDHVGETRGKLGLNVRLAGHWPHLTWNGRLEAMDVAFHEKRLGHDFRILTGTVTMQGDRFVFGCPDPAPAGCQPLRGKLDDSGDLRVEGSVSLPGLELGAVRLKLAGDNLDWSRAGILSLTLSPRTELVGDGNHLKLSGALRLVAGRFQQNYDVKEFILRPRVVESEPWFYEGIPLLENLSLDLVASATGPLVIKNNIADFDVSMPNLLITGTLSRPLLDGEIFVEEAGRFMIPILRGEWVTERGSITFQPDKHFPETPRLDIRAHCDWSDRYDHLKHFLMTFSGTLQEPLLDLRSTDGWDKQQVLAAMATGVAPDELRRSFQNDPTSRGRSGSGADGVIKTLSGQFIGSVIEDPLRNLLKLDVARFELGSDSVFIIACPAKTRHLKLCGTSDIGFVSTARADAKFELKFSDRLSLVSAAEHIEHGLETSSPIINRLKLQMTFGYVLR